MAAAMRSRSCARSISPPASPAAPSASPSRTSRRNASDSGARKKKRSKTSSNTRRSSGDLASVAASASRTSSRRVHDTSPSAANASSSSDVPTATPSLRSSSPSARICPAIPPSGSAGAVTGSPAGGRLQRRAGPVELDAAPLGDDVEVGPVLDDDAHRLAEQVAVDVVGAEQQQRPGPVDRLGDRGRLLEVELADHVDDLDELARHRLGQLG